MLGFSGGHEVNSSYPKQLLSCERGGSLHEETLLVNLHPYIAGVAVANAGAVALTVITGL